MHGTSLEVDFGLQVCKCANVQNTLPQGLSAHMKLVLSRSFRFRRKEKE